jgi:DNA modification methylase
MTNEENGRREGQMIRLVLGDCIEKMQDIPLGTIDAIISDPPYG